MITFTFFVIFPQVRNIPIDAVNFCAYSMIILMLFAVCSAFAILLVYISELHSEMSNTNV